MGLGRPVVPQARCPDPLGLGLVMVRVGPSGQRYGPGDDGRELQLQLKPVVLPGQKVGFLRPSRSARDPDGQNAIFAGSRPTPHTMLWTGAPKAKAKDHDQP